MSLFGVSGGLWRSVEVCMGFMWINVHLWRSLEVCEGFSKVHGDLQRFVKVFGRSMGCLLKTVWVCMTIWVYVEVYG